MTKPKVGMNNCFNITFNWKDNTFKATGEYWTCSATPPSYSSGGNPPESGLEFDKILLSDSEDGWFLVTSSFENNKDFIQKVWDEIESIA